MMLKNTFLSTRVLLLVLFTQVPLSQASAGFKLNDKITRGYIEDDMGRYIFGVGIESDNAKPFR